MREDSYHILLGRKVQIRALLLALVFKLLGGSSSQTFIGIDHNIVNGVMYLLFNFVCVCVCGGWGISISHRRYLEQRVICGGKHSFCRQCFGGYSKTE